MKIGKNTIVFIWILLLVGCQDIPYASDFTTEQPEKAGVIGVYQFKEQTISEAPVDRRGQKGTIILKPDGTYEASNIPNVFNGADVKEHKFIEAKGSWTIEQIGSVENGWGHTKPRWGITLSAIDESLAHIGFLGDEKPYQLVVTFDDAALGEVMIFSKK